ncbi:hypothetical protein JD276_03750 [Leucobacter sp. CSA1]|uniref:Lipoprotein n=1 Tax=Leucobacter chromiisoli TaxID=2796471 RepID=A0A934UUF5_9MICO|nr:hypothetical protein [Leucobacter chromiisoli]MBK0418143.1 hypothetical protein [Leucobacter chromiisoli]
MRNNALAVTASGALALALTTGAVACTAIPTEGSGEVQEMTEDGTGLAEEIEMQVEDALAEVPDSSLLHAVSRYEDVSADTIRVVTEQTLTAEERDELADDVFEYGAAGNDALGAVMVQDGSGEESTHRK